MYLTHHVVCPYNETYQREIKGHMHQGQPKGLTLPNAQHEEEKRGKAKSPSNTKMSCA